MNCKDEFLEHTCNHDILCVSMHYITSVHGEKLHFSLHQNFSKEDFSRFLECLDFEYDARFGLQWVYGFIWYKNGSWSQRYSYDGSECWVHKVPPVIPEKLLRTE